MKDIICPISKLIGRIYAYSFLPLFIFLIILLFFKIDFGLPKIGQSLLYILVLPFLSFFLTVIGHINYIFWVGIFSVLITKKEIDFLKLNIPFIFFIGFIIIPLLFSKNLTSGMDYLIFVLLFTLAPALVAYLMFNCINKD